MSASVLRVAVVLACVSILVLLCVTVSVLADISTSQRALLARADEQLQATRGLGQSVKPFLTVFKTSA